jgi:peptide/nickel transport system ATP-binding protein
MPVLSVERFGLSFQTGRGSVRALDEVSFVAGQGRCVALVGESGSGKSALALAIMGLLPASARIESGRLLFRDPEAGETDLARLKPGSRAYRSLRGGRIGLVFQEPLSAFSAVRPAGEQVLEAVRAHRACSRTEAKARVLDLFTRVGLGDPARVFAAYPFELSGGMRQRVMIAAALAGEPALLIADEPTTALDVTIQAQVLALIDRLKRELGLTILFITHDLGVVASIADDIVVLHKGRVMERGPAGAVFREGRHPYFRALQDANPVIAVRTGRLKALGGTPAATAAYTGRTLKPRGETSGTPLITVEAVSKRYAAGLALDAVSLAIARGECLGLVGESGSGKTTLARAIMRAVAPDAGRVLFHRKSMPSDIAQLTGADLARYRRRVAYVFQDPYAALNPRHTVREILHEPFAIHRIGGPRTREERARELADLVGLPAGALDRHPPAFSGGQRQRIAIARALALRPELVILDEPTSALDVSVQAQILNLLADLRRELGIAMLFVSHDLAVVAHVAERVAVMWAGRLVEEGPVENVFGMPRHPYTAGLLAAAPAADRTQRLDLERAGKAADPLTWPPEFRIPPGERARRAGSVHTVLVRESVLTGGLPDVA